VTRDADEAKKGAARKQRWTKMRAKLGLHSIKRSKPLSKLSSKRKSRR